MQTKHLCFYTFFFALIIVYVLHGAEDRTADTKNIYPFTEVDKRIFDLNKTGTIYSPYSSSYIASFGVQNLVNMVSMTKSTFDTLCRCVQLRVLNAKALKSSDTETEAFCWGEAGAAGSPTKNCTQEKAVKKFIKTSFQRMQNIHNDEGYDTINISLKENDLLFLLKWTYGIKRTNDTVEIMLECGNGNSIIATDSLCAIIDNHKKYEFSYGIK